MIRFYSFSCSSHIVEGKRIVEKGKLEKKDEERRVLKYALKVLFLVQPKVDQAGRSVVGVVDGNFVSSRLAGWSPNRSRISSIA